MYTFKPEHLGILKTGPKMGPRSLGIQGGAGCKNLGICNARAKKLDGTGPPKGQISRGPFWGWFWKVLGAYAEGSWGPRPRAQRLAG